jgi:hypothetical protein
LAVVRVSASGTEFARVETLVAVHYIVRRFSLQVEARRSPPAATAASPISRFPLPYPSQGLLIDIEPIQK